MLIHLPFLRTLYLTLCYDLDFQFLIVKTFNCVFFLIFVNILSFPESLKPKKKEPKWVHFYF